MISPNTSNLTSYLQGLSKRDVTYNQNISELNGEDLFVKQAMDVARAEPSDLQYKESDLFRNVSTTSPQTLYTNNPTSPSSTLVPPSSSPYEQSLSILPQSPINVSSSPLEPPPAFRMDDFLEKLAYHESRGSKDPYTAGNPSGAYGKYQVLPGTLKEAAKEMGISTAYGRTSKGQEDVIRHLTQKNLDAMKRHGLPATYLGAWTYHNQGVTGGRRIMKYEGKPSVANMRSNLPKGIKATSPNYLQYWGSKW